MRIKWEQSVYVGQVPVCCAICGGQARPIRTRGNQYLLAVVYDDRGSAQGEVCRDCLAAGSNGIKDRLQERIQSLQSQLAELQTLVQEDFQVPSLEEEFHSYFR